MFKKLGMSLTLVNFFSAGPLFLLAQNPNNDTKHMARTTRPKHDSGMARQAMLARAIRPTSPILVARHN